MILGIAKVLLKWACLMSLGKEWDDAKFMF